MMTRDQELTELLDSCIKTYAKENRFLEFKSNHVSPEDLGKYISALSNGACLEREENGYLFFGVDDSSHEVVGTSFDISTAKKGNQDLELFLRVNVTPKINFQVVRFYYKGNEGCPISVFIIPAASEQPTCFQNVPYIRVNSSTTNLRDYHDWMRTIYNSKSDWSKEIISEASLSDLDSNAIKKARLGFAERYPDKKEYIDSLDDAAFLDKAKITIGGKITRTALLLLGKEESSHYLNYISQIVWRLNSGDEQAGDIFSIPFLLSTDRVLAKIRNYRFKIYPSNSLIPAEVWKYDTKTILEALHNCIAHQDYGANSRIIVTEEKDCLCFENAGSFFEGHFEDYIRGQRTPARYRNPFLVQAMVNLRMIDTQGYGIHSMFLSQRNRYLPMPDYESTKEKVVLRIPGTVIDEDYSKMLLENTSIGLDEAVLLDALQKKKSLSADAIKLLKKDGLVEGRGKNIFISKYVALATSQETEHSQAKGLSNANYRNIIADYLKDYGELSKRKVLEMLEPHLPKSLDEKQKKYKVENLLASMRRDDLVVCKNSMWSLKKKSC
ncbi:MAG: putative DNA binding domain-containing protein [Candidatus Saccharibacteria bacterium]|nr:putative DNA binding domain-containing protein [Candidatus Saccharibacteria bacterium]